MVKETMGTVTAVSRQWWLKINTKAVRMGPMDGATFPYVIKVRYEVEGSTYTKRKWIPAGKPVPVVGAVVKVFYYSDKPAKATVI